LRDKEPFLHPPDERRGKKGPFPHRKKSFYFAPETPWRNKEDEREKIFLSQKGGGGGGKEVSCFLVG